MHLSDFDLAQLDEARLSELTASQQETLLKKAVADLKEARERLKADSRTSSRPPSSDAPWSGSEAETEPEAEAEGMTSAGEAPETEAADGEPATRANEPPPAGAPSQASQAPWAVRG